MLSHPHICGIGGIGTSGVALLLCDLQIPVTGSDLRPSELTQLLESRGVSISYHPVPERILNASCVIVPAFFPKNHPELHAAQTAGIPVIDRSEALAWICRQHAEHVTLVFGTQQRAQTARAIAESRHCGYCTGMATRDGKPHAKFDKTLIIDLDERGFYHHPKLYQSFSGAHAVISDWEKEDFGYYPSDFSLNLFCSQLTPHTASLEILPPQHRWTLHCPQGIGWFESIGPGHYHEIRMHPVNVASSLKKLHQLACDAPLLAVMRPFVSTLYSYHAEIWAKVLSRSHQILIISPPYEGCTHQDCVEFVQKLCDSACPARLCTLQEAQENARSMPFCLWIGAPDIVSGL